MCRAADLPVTRHAGRPAPGYAGPMAGAYRATTPTPGSVVFVRRGLFREANRPGCAERDRWLFTVPCVAEFAEEGLTFQAVIFICRQPRVRQIYAPRSDRLSATKSPFGHLLTLETTAAGSRMLGGPPLQQRGFPACGDGSSEGPEPGGVPGCWNDDTSAMSHGKGLLTVLREMVDSRGRCVMGESEAALSFTSRLRLVDFIHELGWRGAQVVCPTHSSILAATSGADIIELGEYGFRRVTWDERDRLDHWRRYLANPDRSPRHIVV